MERLEQSQVETRGDMNVMKGEMNQMLEVVTDMVRIEEELRQGVVIRNVIPIFPSALQSALINPLHDGPPRYYRQPMFPRLKKHQSSPIPQPRQWNQAQNWNYAQTRPGVAQERKPIQLEPIPMTYNELFPQLI